MDKFEKNKCEICGNNITIMVFRGSGLCSDNCRKAKAKKEK